MEGTPTPPQTPPALTTLPDGEVYSITDVIERSQFITHLTRTDTEDQARQFIDLIKHEHATATHNCSAFYIHQPQATPLERSSDDGEPAGTAGAPMLGALKHSGLISVTAVVTRYFGGIKLGTGGLVDAYSSAVERACREAPKIQRLPMQHVCVTTDAAIAGKLDGYIRNHGFDVIDTRWGTPTIIDLYVPPEDIDTLRSLVAEVSSGTAQMTFRHIVLVDRPLTA